ncbi:hypothetical protein CVT24_009697 [Panaeolus cyanescens]|uniref:Sacsin/Nov domain-containing protein n=1 Tax=Panaeolus cyanescens TaxID=181874 RepID=A0A409Y9T5_9AGAR|nr:hypothetical protein CVT24_009697 [Panaeolus cyanescens]
MNIPKDALWETGHDETVEVNQRALIDKVLARYSGEFTVFRELLQNSDDAQSKAVEIRFETETYAEKKGKGGEGVVSEGVSAPKTLPDLKTALVQHWIFRNNGIVFRDEDWSRLKKIAEGNPDEEKIGAFGVGFYSLFSVTEEPFVTSGDQWMGFYWKDKKDQLFARRGKLPAADEDPSGNAWTTFSMELREQSPMPLAFDLTRFLASSITFMRHLVEVSVYFDDKRLVRLTKTTGIPRDLGIPKGLNSRSPSGIMTVEKVYSTPLHIQAEVMKWIYTSGSQKKPPPPKVNKPATQASGGFFSSLFSSFAGNSTPRLATPVPLPPPVVETVNHLAINETSVSLSIFSAAVLVRLNQKLSSEIHRSTKKNPPAKMSYELIYTAKNEYDASVQEDAKQPEATGSIFQGLRADLDGAGLARIFIGHSTAQTTGLGGHMAGRFIPTVERESIDFMDRNVAVWNKELLHIGGFLARSAYEMELDTVKAQWEGSSTKLSLPDAEIRQHLTDRVLHALKFFSFYTSTPSAEVSSLLEQAFFACSKDGSFRMISDKGIRNSKDIRIPDATFSKFLKNLPVIPLDVLEGARPIVSILQTKGFIKQINFQDVLDELRVRPLDLEECIACLEWWTSIYQRENASQLHPVRAQLLDAAILSIDGPDQEAKIIPLNTIRYVINPRTLSIPTNGPLPNTLLPLSVSKAFRPDQITAAFPWQEFTVVEWLKFICTQHQDPAFDLSLSPAWAEQVITTTARYWPSLHPDMKSAVYDLFNKHACIPTSNGMKLPTDSYFPNVNIFKDLPIVTFPSGLPIKGGLEKLLQGLGVRKHVDLQLIFTRMIKTNEWTTAELVKYLVSVRDSLSAQEIERLKHTPAFPQETDKSDKPPRSMAGNLYEPLDVFRSMKLPVLDWGKQAKWKGSSDEAKFLYDIGLRRYPPLKDLITLCSDVDPDIRTTALKYLVDNIPSRYPDYDPYDFKDVKFLPAKSKGASCLATIQEVFSTTEWAVMNFLTLDPAYTSYATKLQVKEAPHTSQLTELLRTRPPSSVNEGKAWFQLLATRLHEFKRTELELLSKTAFIPIQSGKTSSDTGVQWLPPSQCYLSGESDETFHSKLFVFVDFGSAGNSFLVACGTRSRPNVEEVVKILLADPSRFYQLTGGSEHFLSELRNIAVNVRAIPSVTLERMKRSPILLGVQRRLKPNPKKSGKTTDDWDEEEWDVSIELKRPTEIVIVDDTQSYQAFGTSLYTAPQEDLIEALYLELGSKKLSQVVKERYQTSNPQPNSKLASETRTLILERLPLFLHENTHPRAKIPFNWLTSGNNFVVEAYGKVEIEKQLQYNGLSISKKQDASAVAFRVNARSPVKLCVAVNTQLDMFEVATSLNRLMFDSPKANDTLLLMTILSTDLKSLKRRGYNAVDRIIRQQRETRLAAEAELKKAREPGPVLPGSFGSPPSDSLHDRRAAPPVPEKPIASTLTNSFMNLRKKIGMTSASHPDHRSEADENRPSSPPNNLPGPVPGGFPGPSQTRSDTGEVTPKSNISRNIDMAIDSCKPESGGVLRNREHMQRIRETLEEGYCDISGRKGDLHMIGQMGPIKIYLSEEIPQEQSASFLRSKHDPIARFIHIMTTMADIYSLPLTSLHIFYDLKGGIIAFNRNGSIFLNLRYFEAWHDADVKNGILEGAYTSWYFTLAHEIAHNLVQPHNSEHEFYFSAICEKFMIPLSRLLTSK